MNSLYVADCSYGELREDRRVRRILRIGSERRKEPEIEGGPLRLGAMMRQVFITISSD